MTLTKVSRAATGASVNDPCARRLAIARNRNRLRIKVVRKDNVGDNKLSHLPTVGMLHDALGQSDDQFTRAICFTAATEARLVPSTL